jgi:hypothetical protein
MPSFGSLNDVTSYCATRFSRARTSESQVKTALFISPDLLFAGKIQSAAVPLEMRVVQTVELSAIRQALAENHVSIIFLDLNVSEPTIGEVMELFADNPRPMVVAFGPHVNTARLEEAKRLGCDRVLPRSRFAMELPSLLMQAATAN